MILSVPTALLLVNRNFGQHISANFQWFANLFLLLILAIITLYFLARALLATPGRAERKRAREQLKEQIVRRIMHKRD